MIFLLHEYNSNKFDEGIHHHNYRLLPFQTNIHHNPQRVIVWRITIKPSTRICLKLYCSVTVSASSPYSRDLVRKLTWGPDVSTSYGRAQLSVLVPKFSYHIRHNRTSSFKHGPFVNCLHRATGKLMLRLSPN